MGYEFKKGDRVRLAPRNGRDFHYGSNHSMNTITPDQIGTIGSISKDAEGFSSYNDQRAEYCICAIFPGMGFYNYAEYELLPEILPVIAELTTKISPEVEEQFYRELLDG